jgi:hypothetical protein
MFALCNHFKFLLDQKEVNINFGYEVSKYFVLFIPQLFGGTYASVVCGWVSWKCTFKPH